MKCAKCGTLAMPEDRFCGACGAPLSETPTTAVSSQPSTAVATQASLNTAYLHYRLGLVDYKQGKLKQAIESWKHTLEVDPTHAEAQEMLERATLELQIAGG